ncbi:spore germination protein [Neobacillus mesonae]|nr:spore germination protein [Neobacillus mesonae]
MDLITRVNEHFKDNSDYFCMEIQLSGYPAILMGLESLIDVPQTITLLQLQHKQSDPNRAVDQPHFSNLGNMITAPELATSLSHILEGKIILADNFSHTCISIRPVLKNLTRSISEPVTENTLYGSNSAFLEDMNTNIGIFRKHITSSTLKIESYTFDGSQPKLMSLFYLEDRINPVLLQNLQQKIKSGLSKEVLHIQHLVNVLGLSSWSFISRFNITELPQNAANALNDGKALIMLDRLPFGIIVPNLATDMFCQKDDHNYSYPFMLLIRMLRLIGILIAIVIPGLYVALVSVNPEVLRLELALSIASSRQGVPYPALIETLLLLIVLELILEASVRLPKSVGPTITMVGGIILGQAAVTAKLVSNLLIIILAGTTIASSVVVGFENSISVRVFKYLLILLSSIFGLLGLLAGIVLICAYMGNQTTMGIPYLSRSGLISAKNGKQ